MSELDDIARRLDAVAGIDWCDTRRLFEDEQAAVAEFVRHAAADITYLLTQIDSTAMVRASDDA
ncbi:hypothetical protein HII36_05530 [Nonomuraea sp. NN258]|uniref:hypothetical protein n=1 Tax=Nonomuraea antri TaxID=2730852 RepID=UPI00156878CA|nr:hypothetical protein [Nonomuraea antri]NRQ31299.1 hypothetical protein [Nonomuraea antri]